MTPASAKSGSSPAARPSRPATLKVSGATRPGTGHQRVRLRRLPSPRPRPAPRAPAGPGGAGRAASLVEQGDPLLDALERPDHVALEADQDRRRRTRRRRAGSRPPPPGPRRRSGRSASRRPGSARAPRSGRRPAPGHGRRSGRPPRWAFSMIRSPSALIRLAALTSSGIAARSSSIRSRRPSRSMTTLVRRAAAGGRCRSASRAGATRKMMSMGVALLATRRVDRTVVRIIARPAGPINAGRGRPSAPPRRGPSR